MGKTVGYKRVAKVKAHKTPQSFYLRISMFFIVTRVSVSLLLATIITIHWSKITWSSVFGLGSCAAFPSLYCNDIGGPLKNHPIETLSI